MLLVPYKRWYSTFFCRITDRDEVLLVPYKRWYSTLYSL